MLCFLNAMSSYENCQEINCYSNIVNAQYQEIQTTTITYATMPKRKAASSNDAQDSNRINSFTLTMFDMLQHWIKHFPAQMKFTWFSFSFAQYWWVTHTSSFARSIRRMWCNRSICCHKNIAWWCIIVDNATSLSSVPSGAFHLLHPSFSSPIPHQRSHTFII